MLEALMSAVAAIVGSVARLIDETPDASQKVTVKGNGNTVVQSIVEVDSEPRIKRSAYGRAVERSRHGEGWRSREVGACEPTGSGDPYPGNPILGGCEKPGTPNWYAAATARARLKGEWLVVRQKEQQDDGCE